MLRKLIPLAISAGMFVTTACAQRNVIATAERYSGDQFTVSVDTPKGAHVFAIHQPPAAVLNAVDSGLAELFAVARKNGYSRRLNYGDYTIFIGKADRTKDSTGAYSPGIAIGSAQYAGSVYDQGGFIYVAGMVISNDPCAFLIAEHTQDLAAVSNIVRYEGEHLVLYHNDRQRYLATMDHSKGGSHPILQ